MSYSKTHTHRSMSPTSEDELWNRVSSFDPMAIQEVEEIEVEVLLDNPPQPSPMRKTAFRIPAPAQQSSNNSSFKTNISSSVDSTSSSDASIFSRTATRTDSDSSVFSSTASLSDVTKSPTRSSSSRTATVRHGLVTPHSIGTAGPSRIHHIPGIGIPDKFRRTTSDDTLPTLSTPDDSPKRKHRPVPPSQRPLPFCPPSPDSPSPKRQQRHHPSSEVRPTSTRASASPSKDFPPPIPAPAFTKSITTTSPTSPTGPTTPPRPLSSSSHAPSLPSLSSSMATLFHSLSSKIPSTFAKAQSSPTRTPATATPPPRALEPSVQVPAVPPAQPSPTWTPAVVTPPPRVSGPYVQAPAAPPPPPPPPVKAKVIPEYDHILGSGTLELPTEIISFDKGVQRDMDLRGIPFGVQYELARGINLGLWKWRDVTPSLLNQLKGSNAEAVPKVARVMLQGKTGNAVPKGDNLDAFHGSHLVWEEYDREQEALLEGKGRGLGLMDEYHGVEKWYGGRIQQIARFVKENGKPKWVLDQPEMKRSNRFARFLGSRRMLEVKISKKDRYQGGDELFDMLAKRFVLLGRVYVPIDAKDDKVYLIEINENYEREPSEAQGDFSRLSFQQFISWHNPLSRNSGQPISKWTTRFDLGLSTSVPVLKFKPENVHFIDDIEIQHYPGEKVPAERCMTDGCGFMNRAALVKIAQALKLPGPPPAVQGRGMGCKGLWTLHPDPEVNADPEPAIWHRASQHKIQLGNLAECDPSHLVFDLVAPARVTCPGRLSMQLIMNMSHNGVPDHVFQTLLRESLEEEVAPLMRWTGPNVRPALWAAVMRAGNVMGMRLQRLAGATARAQGLARRFEMADSDDEAEDIDIDMADVDGSFSQAPPQASAGPPDSLYEVVLQLFEAGFLPESSEFLNSKLRQVLKNVIESFVAKYHIVVPCSAEVFCIPDPVGVLKPGEIHFKSTRELRDSDTGLTIDIVTGPVLISRNPTRVASDVQKVQAIHHPLLSDYKDVVVFSTQGDRSQASKGGGGDTFLIIWYRPLVDAFTTPELVLPEADFMEQNFRRSVTRVPDFCADLQAMDARSAHKVFIKTLMGSLHDRRVGFYSQCHDNAVYAFGYNDPVTVRLAHMFCVCLDSNKSGYRLIDDVRKRDSLAYMRDRPHCMLDKSKPTEGKTANNRLVRRQSRPFVLEQLLETGKELADTFLVQFESLRMDSNNKPLPWPSDPALDRLYNLALELSPGHPPAWKKELNALERHITALKGEYDLIFGKSSSSASVKTSRKDQEKAVKALAKRFFQRPTDTPQKSVIIPLEDPQQRAELRASCAYYIATKGASKKASFAFSMTFQDLCRMKAAATGASGARMIITEIADLLTMPASAMRLLVPASVTTFGGL